MGLRFSRFSFVLLVAVVTATALQAQTQSSSSSSSKHVRKPTPGADSAPDAGSVTAGVYRNKGFGLSCRIPAGWVLRTEEMNVRDEEDEPTDDKKTDQKNSNSKSAEAKSRATLDRKAEGGCSHTNSCGRVLLAAFSRPPEAKGEDVNASILIAAESVAAYPGLKEAAQYLGPVEEVAKAQGFSVVQELYETAIGATVLAREDFQKDVGSRVMRQSTLVMLARGYAVSFTFIGGTEDEVEELVSGLSFGVGGKAGQ